MANPTLEKRVSELEQKVADLMEKKEEIPHSNLWVRKWFGAFKDDPAFDSAMERGAEYRRSQPTPAEEQDGDLSSGH